MFSFFIPFYASHSKRHYLYVSSCLLINSHNIGWDFFICLFSSTFLKKFCTRTSLTFSITALSFALH